MSAEYRPDCPCCASRSLRRLSAFDRAHLFRCHQCGFVFAGKVPSAEELQAHYSHKYQNKYVPGAWVSDTTRKRLDELVAEFQPRRQANRLLDVGCGRGLTLEAAAKAGWKCYGTEYSEDALRFGRERGFAMHEGDVGPDTYPRDFFDVIVMTEVIEHVPQPRQELELVSSFLRPGGLLYLTTPNFDSLSRRALGQKWTVIGYPYHLSYFTARTLGQLLGSLSLRTVRWSTTGFSPTRFKKSLLGQEHPVNSPGDADELVRSTIESRAYLRLAKSTLNLALTKARLGDQLKMYAERA